MAVSSVMQNALSGLIANQTAMHVTSDNISNVNNPDFARRQVVQQNRVSAGVGAGVEIAEIRRVADKFLAAQGLVAHGDAGRYGAIADLHDRMQSLLGDPSSSNALSAQIEQAFDRFGTVALDPSSTVRRTEALSALSQAFSEFGRISDGIASLRTEADQRLAAGVTSANDTIIQIDSLNSAIQKAAAAGLAPNDLIDQRDKAVKALSQFVDLRTTQQPNGRLYVMTNDGMPLVNDTRYELRYDAGATGGAYGGITAHLVHPITGNVDPNGATLDSHIRSGEIRGLMEMRDNVLPDMQASLGELAGTFADALNAIHTDNATVPAASVLHGGQTGLVAGDPHRFTGKTSIAVIDADGALVRRVDLDFTANTVSANGAAPTAIPGGSQIGNLVSAINTALGGAGSASFSGGVLTLQAAGGNGVAVAQDATVPSNRGGQSFAQFFGLNDLVRAGAGPQFKTGLTTGDAHGFTAGETMTLRLAAPDGRTVDRTITVSGATMGDLLASLNDPATGFGGKASFALDSNGALSITPAAGFQGARVQVVTDGTVRGNTGTSFSGLFGLGENARFGRASQMSLGPDVSGVSGTLATAKLALDAATAPGTVVLTRGDTAGVLALQGIGDTPLSFAVAGQLGATTRTAGQYSADLLALSGSLAAQAGAMRDSREAVKTEADQQIAGVSGVNLDEELVNMMTYQKAYSASARLIQTADQMLNELLNLVGN